MSNQHLETQNNLSLTADLDPASAAAGRSIGRLIWGGNSVRLQAGGSPEFRSTPRVA